MIGKTVSHYRIVDRLGVGGMGVVYKAEDIRLGRTVACKFLPKELAGNEQALMRFRREALAASALNHPNICTLYDICDHDDQPCMIMELIEGRRLDEIINGAPVDTDTILRLGIQIADALDAAHARGIIHRDIKPANVFVTAYGQAKILDFGLAKLSQKSWPSQGQKQSSPPAESLVTSPGMPLGTAAYMSPEQVRGEQIDGRSDLFSFGALLYEMAAGRPPFEGPTYGVIFEAIMNRDPLPPRVWNPGLPTPLQEIILTALQKDVGSRYQSAADLKAALTRFQQRGVNARIIDNLPVGTKPLDAQDPAAKGRKPESALPQASDRDRIKKTAENRMMGRRGLIAAVVTALMIIAAGALYFLPRATYYPCIVIDEFHVDSDTVSPGLTEFMLKRTLSQFSDAAVYDRREFGLARRLDQGEEPVTSEGGMFSSYWKKWAGGPASTGLPALQVRADIQQSMGALVLSVDLTNRGHEKTFTERYWGTGQLVTKGIDDLAQRILRAYDPSLLGRYSGSSRTYRSAVNLLSDNLDALRHYWRGALAWDHLDMGLAEHELRSTLEIDPRFALARLMLGEVRVFQNQWDAAQAEILAAKEQSGALTEIDQLRINALLARVSGKTFEERVELEKLIGLQPHRREYIYELAESYFHTADADEAIPKYQEALTLDESYALAYNHLGYCYAWKGAHDKALEALTRYLEIDPSPNAYDSLGDAYIHAGAYEKAAEMKGKAVMQDPTMYYAKRSLALIEILQGKYHAARERLRKLVAETDDASQKARYLAVLAFLDYQTNHPGPALQACDRGLGLIREGRIDAPNDELIWLKGLIELKLGNLDGANKALALLRRMLDENSITAMNYKPAYKYWLHLLASIRAEEGKKEEAALALKDLAWVKDKLGYWSTPHDRAFMMDSAGRIYEETGLPAEAEKSYRDSLEYNPHFAAARLHLAGLLLNQGHMNEARSEIEAFYAAWETADRDAGEILAAGLMMTSMKR